MSDTDPTALFERMYRAAADGGDGLPWDRGGPHRLLEEWARDVAGDGRHALVVGSGLGGDAEFLTRRGFAVVAFDASPTAITMVRERHPDSVVDYEVADLLDLPSRWVAAFDLVVETLTVQSLPIAYHPQATANVARTVASGGTLLVIATARDDDAPTPDGPPWPLTRAEIDAFAGAGPTPVRIEKVRTSGAPDRWCAEYRRT